MERERQTDRQTDRDRGRDRPRQTDPNRDTDRQTRTERNKEVCQVLLFREKEERHTRTCRYLDRRIDTQTDKQRDSINVGASRKTAVPVTPFLVSGNIVTGRVFFRRACLGRGSFRQCFFGPGSLWQCFFGPGSIRQCFFRAG